jgi:hypothetical protein
MNMPWQDGGNCARIVSHCRRYREGFPKKGEAFSGTVVVSLAEYEKANSAPGKSPVGSSLAKGSTQASDELNTVETIAVAILEPITIIPAV